MLLRLWGIFLCFTIIFLLLLIQFDYILHVNFFLLLLRNKKFFPFSINPHSSLLCVRFIQLSCSPLSQKATLTLFSFSYCTYGIKKDSISTIDRTHNEILLAGNVLCCFDVKGQLRYCGNGGRSSYLKYISELKLKYLIKNE